MFEKSTSVILPICNATLLEPTDDTPYGCYLKHDTIGASTTFTAILMTLYSVLALWALWELSFQCYRAKTVVSSLFSQTTWICFMCFVNGLFFINFYAVKKWSYDDRRAFETLRGLADMSQFTLALFVCNAWIDMSTSLSKYSCAGKAAPTFSVFHKFLQHCGWINVAYITFRTLEIIFRLPAPYGLRTALGGWAATGCRGMAVLLYVVLMVCIVRVTYTTYMKLRGLVAKRKAGDLLKRKVLQMTLFISLSCVIGFLMTMAWLLRENVYKKMYPKSGENANPEGYYWSSLPFEFCEYFFIFVLWVPSTLENSPSWCGNWCRKEHWFYCCYSAVLRKDVQKSGSGGNGGVVVWSNKEKAFKNVIPPSSQASKNISTQEQHNERKKMRR